MLIKSKKVWVLGQFLPLIIEIKDEKITNIYDYNDKKNVDYDFLNNRIFPGFIDIHTHGAYGFDTNDAEEEGLKTWAEKLPEEGVTSFLPTTITQKEEVLIKALENIKKVANSNYKGAEILGVNFEGPYLDEEKRGAQPLNCLQKPDINQFKKYFQASGNLIKIITMACEKDKNFELTKYIASLGIKVSLGHSSATYKQSALSFLNGASSQTHVFNGMSGFHHRENGQVGFALSSSTEYGEIITDGIHSTIQALKIFFNAKGKNYALMVTDCLCAKGLKEGKYIFGGENITIYPDGSAHRDDGRLAGSTLKISNGLKILIEKANIDMESAINSCTINPAKFLGIDNKKGKIKVGCDADITVLDDEYNTLFTLTKGKIAFKNFSKK